MYWSIESWNKFNFNEVFLLLPIFCYYLSIMGDLIREIIKLFIYIRFCTGEFFDALEPNTNFFSSKRKNISINNEIMKCKFW